MSTEKKVSSLPDCDFGCGGKAEYDFKTALGPWANGCTMHYTQNRAFTSLGTGRGQKLVLRQPPASPQHAASLSYEEWMDEVNEVLDKYDLHTDDLPDQDYADWYEDFISPRQAAARALRYE